MGLLLSRTHRIVRSLRFTVTDSEMRTSTETHSTYLHKIFNFSGQNPTRPAPKRVSDWIRLTNNLTEPIYQGFL